MATDTAYVIGSGPAGVACATALLARGTSVTMLDVGLELEPQLRARVEALARLRPEQWSAEALDPLKSSLKANAAGVAVKTVYGSDYPYRDTEKSLPLSSHGVRLLPSFAQGGFSAVWGSAALPFRPDDIAEWPVSADELAPHYRAVLEFMPLAAAADRLERLFPLYTTSLQTLKPGMQAGALLSALEAHHEELERAGIRAGGARLAVRGEDGGKPSGCVYCGLCMYGCPYGHIYGTAQTLAALRRHPRFEYIPGTLVKRVGESGGRVRIDAVDFALGASRSFAGRAAYLAGGVLPTTRILLESTGGFDRPVRVATSQHFMFPLWLAGGVPDVRREPLHTLAQVFIEVDDPEISRRSVHLQVYAYNDLYPQVLKKMGIGVLLAPFPGAMDRILGRLAIVQGYLHSDDTGSIELTLAAPSGAEPRLTLRARPNADVRRRVRRLLAKLAALRKAIGARPVALGAKLSPLGYGFHNGGSFPMRADPTVHESDRWGRPCGFKRIFAVDATVLPAIPATTVTFGIMANAHRIGSFHE